jgi:predicted nucleic acid-binding protein
MQARFHVHFMVTSMKMTEFWEVLGRQTGSTKPRCEASCRRLHGTEVVIAVSQTIPSGHRAAPRHTSMYAFHRYGALVVMTV